jgi:hypothetical protein
MSKYRSLILVAIPIILVVALLLSWPNVVRSYPLVFGVALAIGIVFGILAIVLRRGPPPSR